MNLIKGISFIIAVSLTGAGSLYSQELVLSQEFADTGVSSSGFLETGETHSEGGLTLDFSDPFNSTYRGKDNSFAVTPNSDSLTVGSNLFYIRPDDVNQTIRFDSVIARSTTTGDDGAFRLWGLDNREPSQAHFTLIGEFSGITSSQPGELLSGSNSDFWAALRFDSGQGGDTVSIDNLSVSAIPEPGTYALLVGLGCLLMVGIRRFRKA